MTFEEALKSIGETGESPRVALPPLRTYKVFVEGENPEIVQGHGISVLENGTLLVQELVPHPLGREVVTREVFPAGTYTRCTLVLCPPLTENSTPQ